MLFSAIFCYSGHLDFLVRLNGGAILCYFLLFWGRPHPISFLFCKTHQRKRHTPLGILSRRPTILPNLFPSIFPPLSQTFLIGLSIAGGCPAGYTHARGGLGRPMALCAFSMKATACVLPSADALVRCTEEAQCCGVDTSTGVAGTDVLTLHLCRDDGPLTASGNGYACIKERTTSAPVVVPTDAPVVGPTDVPAVPDTLQPTPAPMFPSLGSCPEGFEEKVFFITFWCRAFCAFL